MMENEKRFSTPRPLTPEELDSLRQSNIEAVKYFKQQLQKMQLDELKETDA